MIKIAYTNMESKIKINAFLSYPLTFVLVRQAGVFTLHAVMQYCG